MPLDKVEIAVLSCVTIGAVYLSVLLLGWQALVLILTITTGVVYVMLRRWAMLRERGTYG
jgi:hypothetical protein